MLDLTDIVRLQAYNQVASDLKEFGKVSSLNSILIREYQVDADKPFLDLCNSILQLDEYIATIDIIKIKEGKYIAKFRNSYKNVVRKVNLSDPIKNILKELSDEISAFILGMTLEMWRQPSIGQLSIKC